MKFSINIKLATSWNELTEMQLREIASAFEYYRTMQETQGDKVIDYLNTRLCIALVKNLLRTNNPLKTWIALKQLPPEEYLKHIKFLLEGVARTKFPESFKLKRIKLYPPGPRLSNLTIKEFSFADSLYYNWKKKKQQIHLDLLCATLYRSGIGSDPEVDPRKKFNRNVVEQDVDMFSRLPQKNKLAIACAYEGSRNYIVKLYPNIFPPPRKLSKEELELQQKQPEPKYTPFGELLTHKIQFDPSKLERTQNLNLHEFLGTYENELKELKKQKK